MATCFTWDQLQNRKYNIIKYKEQKYCTPVLVIVTKFSRTLTESQLFLQLEQKPSCVGMSEQCVPFLHKSCMLDEDNVKLFTLGRHVVANWDGPWMFAADST